MFFINAMAICHDDGLQLNLLHVEVICLQFFLPLLNIYFNFHEYANKATDICYH